MPKILLIALFLVSEVWVTPAYAVTAPSFPVCANPQGSQKVSYSTGTHGIVGSTATYIGSDTVYTLSNETLVQCFCAADGNGIQSNWWKATGLIDTDIQTLKDEGWYFVPNGSLWGLSNDPYVVHNSNYTCGATGGQVQAAFADNPNLATTGNAVLIWGMGVAGVGFLILAFYLYYKNRS